MKTLIILAAILITPTVASAQRYYNVPNYGRVRVGIPWYAWDYNVAPRNYNRNSNTNNIIISNNNGGGGGGYYGDYEDSRAILAESEARFWRRMFFLKKMLEDVADD